MLDPVTLDTTRHEWCMLQGVHESASEAKSSKFKQYDALTFVVTVLNFLREEAAPLLAPGGERSHQADRSLPASAVKESAPG